MQPKSSYPFFVKRDLDGFFGLFIDNLVQLLAIVGLCEWQCGMVGDDARFIYAHMLPGAAISILLGNIFYAWQAHRLARREKRGDVTALPYGINTPSMIVFIFFVMAPAYQRTQDASFAWKMGLIACLGSGVIEFLGCFVAERLRQHTPRAALLSTLAGIAIGFIAMTFAYQIFQNPLVAMLPLAIILITYFANGRFPLGLPGGLVAVVAGTLCAWILTAVSNIPNIPDWISRSALSIDRVREAANGASLAIPQWAGNEILTTLQENQDQIPAYASVIIAMGLFNVIGSLQNVESAEAAGDRYSTGPSLAVNGIGTIAAALLGSCFPTTIYIGHPGWKGMGARAGYSTLNGIVISAICCFGVVGLISTIVPMEAGIAIVLWIGIIITAQAFTATPKEHAPAVAIGLFPAISAWGATLLIGSTGAFAAAAGTSIQEYVQAASDSGQPALVSGFLIEAMLIIERGYIITCMILSAIAAFLIDRKFGRAAIWSLVAAILTFLGVMHAYQLQGNNLDFLLIWTVSSENSLTNRAFPVGIGYLLFAACFYLFGRYNSRS